MQNQTVLASAARTASGTADVAFIGGATKGVLLNLNVSARSGTSPTLDIKLQYTDPLSGAFVDVPGASFSQKTATGADTLCVYPTITASANRAVAQFLPSTFHVVYTIAGTTPSFTFSLSATEIR
jgi:hypothetical protein